MARNVNSPSGILFFPHIWEVDNYNPTKAVFSAYIGLEEKQYHDYIQKIKAFIGAVNVEEKEDMSRYILDVNNEFGTTVALIEHDMGVVMDISDRVVVMDYGKKIGDGTPDEVRNNQSVIDAYLGVSEH